jgi:glycosyl-4,4'-diaponeurosporenoate acyltransferase
MNGVLYSRYLGIHKWKGKLPDGAVLFKGSFEKKHMEQHNELYLEDFVCETCRAELIHWITFLFGFLFFIWNLWWVGIIMVIYALAVNIPCILAQRYNRIRLLRVLRRLREKNSY